MSELRSFIRQQLKTFHHDLSGVGIYYIEPATVEAYSTAMCALSTDKHEPSIASTEEHTANTSVLLLTSCEAAGGSVVAFCTKYRSTRVAAGQYTPSPKKFFPQLHRCAP